VLLFYSGNYRCVFGGGVYYLSNYSAGLFETSAGVRLSISAAASRGPKSQAKQILTK